MEGKSLRKRIIKALMRHPEGLTLVSLAKATGLHRHTSTKYLHELIGAGLVYQRKVGPAKLCYLKEKIESKESEKRVLKELERRTGRKSQMKFIAAVLLWGTVLASGAVIAFNLLNETLNVSYTGKLALNFTLDNETQILSQENTSVEIVSNETNETQEIPEIPIISEPSIDISIEYPEKITRGNFLNIKARIENSSSAAKDIVVSWVLPEGFEIVSEENNCEILEQNSSCYSKVLVYSSLSSELGTNEIKFGEL